MIDLHSTTALGAGRFIPKLPKPPRTGHSETAKAYIRSVRIMQRPAKRNRPKP